MKTALITGVARGVGAATAKLFAERDVSVYGIDRTEPSSNASLSGFVKVDLADLNTVRSRVETLLAKISQLDVLVNNAAVQHCASVGEMSVERFREVLDVNLTAPFVLVQACLSRLEAAKGAVVNVSSVHATATSERIAAYAASKGGLTALTRALSLELARLGVRVNTVLPGAVDTEMLSAGLARSDDGRTAGERLAAFAKRHPLGRVGTPEDIARAIWYLADSDQSGFITGASLTADGGVTARLSTETDL